ncbi:hypothetical protein [Peribacillus sp. SCS-155]|uniref:hypothetical protein n=1 Tax=Peribacillus sedimenti TaxID=3115297 RepID=UPI0039064CA7
MGKRKEPKFKKGDTVVITMYGTVGKITDVKYIDGTYVYAVNNSEGLYIENTLQHISEYKGEVLFEKELIDIQYKYFFGDLVQVEGYGKDYFKVVGFRTEIWRYKENAWEDVIYELSRVTDGEWLEAHEDELTFVAEAEKAEQFLKKQGVLPQDDIRNAKSGTASVPAAPKQKKIQDYTFEERMRIIDSLLDLYNDYKILYEFFGDIEYKHVMNLALIKLRKAAKEIYGNPENAK